MKRSKFISLLMSHSPDEDIEIVFLGDGKGYIVFGKDKFGYYDVFEDDVEVIEENSKIVAISLNTF